MQQDDEIERRTREALACLARKDTGFRELAKYEEFFKILAGGPHTVPPKTEEMAKLRRRVLRTSQAHAFRAESTDPYRSGHDQVASLHKFCTIVAGGEHEIPDSDVQTARATLKRLVTGGAPGCLGAARSEYLAAKTSNFAKSTIETLYSAERYYRMFLDCVAWGADDVQPQDVEDARIALAAVLFAAQCYPEALAEATAFTTKCPEHKRPLVPNVFRVAVRLCLTHNCFLQPWMIRAYILNETDKDGAREAYLVALERWNALEPHEREDEKIGRQLTLRTLAPKFPPPQAAPGKSPRPAKKQRTDQPSAASKATLPAETCQTGPSIVPVLASWSTH